MIKLVKKYRKKPVVIAAMQFDGSLKSMYELSDFIDDQIVRMDYSDPDNPILEIQTLEGPHIARVGDYIIKGVEGEFYPCKPDIFKKTYEEYEVRRQNPIPKVPYKI